MTPVMGFNYVLSPCDLDAQRSTSSRRDEHKMPSRRHDCHAGPIGAQ